MNGLDPAGMHDMRDMIIALVAEGRTVVLSSHLLDEVERTCDAVAIVDRGNIIRQGPISELLSGASLVLQVECSEPTGPVRSSSTPPSARERRARTVRVGDHFPRRDRSPGRRRDQSRSRRGRHLGVPAAGDSGISRVVVPAGHEPLGGPGMTTAFPCECSGPVPSRPRPVRHDHRGSWIPTGGQIATRLMELRKRRGLMIALIAVTIGLPTIFLVVRLLTVRLSTPTMDPPVATTSTRTSSPA